MQEQAVIEVYDDDIDAEFLDLESTDKQAFEAFFNSYDVAMPGQKFGF